MPKKKAASNSKAIGRPSILTQDVIRKLEEAFCMDATDGEACAFAGISEASYYHHRKENEDFSDQMDRAKQFPFMLAKKGLLQALKEGDGNLLLKWLKNRQRDRYHEKVEEVMVDKTVDA